MATLAVAMLIHLARVCPALLHWLVTKTAITSCGILTTEHVLLLSQTGDLISGMKR